MGDVPPTSDEKFSMKMANAIATEVKHVIATENLHVLCDEGTGSIIPIDKADLALTLDGDLKGSLAYGWHPDAEKRIAETISKAMAAVVRNASPLEFASSDEMIKELKKRSDLFFMAMTPNTQEEWEWRRSFKGGHAYPLIGFVKMNLDALSLQWAQEAEMVPVEGDEDSEDGERSDDEGSPSDGA